MLYQNRSDAAAVGQRKFATFMTIPMPGGWRLADMSNWAKESPAAEYANGKDFIGWVETHFVDEGRKPGVRGVIVVNVFKDELPEDMPAEFEVQPRTPSLWDGGRDDEIASTGSVLVGGRVRSAIESPVKTVWRIADEMKGAPRAEVIAACISAGVNKATAGTQYYKWAKAQAA